jgi:hypothetical protein
VIHDLNTKSKGPELLFDSSLIRPEFRGKVRAALTEASDFMKHADRGRAGSMKTVALTTELTDGFILFAIMGLQHLGENLGPEEIAFRMWQGLHKPEIMSEAWRDLIENRVDGKAVVGMRALPKGKFFDQVCEAQWHPPSPFGVTRESFMPRRIKPWIEPNDFEAFRQSAVDHLDLPDTYDEWLELATQEETKFGAVGIALDKVIVHPNEFASYCLAGGLEKNAVTFGAFAVAKAGQQQKG